jgi:uncharacterized protein
MTKTTKNPWYAAGLHFKCLDCGQCCSGPDSGYIWANQKEIELIAEFLKMSVEDFRKRYTKNIMMRTTLIENPQNKDCIFLEKVGDQKRCLIYQVRPFHCRSWPFWSSNLASSDAWNQVAQSCPGINRGKFFSYEQIQSTKVSKNWWIDVK